MPGYEGAINSAFEPDGSLRQSYLTRVRRVIEACDRQGWWSSSAATTSGRTRCWPTTPPCAPRWSTWRNGSRTRGYRNVVLEVANEFDHDGFDHPLLRTEEGEVELIRLAKETAPGLLVSTSGLGHGRYPESWPGPPISS